MRLNAQLMEKVHHPGVFTDIAAFQASCKIKRHEPNYETPTPGNNLSVI